MTAPNQYNEIPSLGSCQAQSICQTCAFLAHEAESKQQTYFLCAGIVIPLPPLVNSEQKMTVLGSTQSATKGRPCPRLDRHPAARASETFAPGARPNHVATPRKSSNWEICATSTTEENVASKSKNPEHIPRCFHLMADLAACPTEASIQYFTVTGLGAVQIGHKKMGALPTRKAISQH